ncbi:MAG TPA: LuxR family transcriptional regulator [Croceibacterium sp.]|nr:LuxR family transcriptional regulator [Croceibacterium sp.]
MTHIQDVTEFIEASRGASSTAELTTLLDAATRQMGFDSYAVFHEVGRDHPEPWRHGLSNHPWDYIELWLQRWRAHDPIALASHRTFRGFRFDEASAFVVVSRQAKEVMAEARRAGVTDGFCVPIHVPGELDGFCTFVVRGGAALPAKALPTAQLVGLFAYEAASRIVWPQARPQTPPVGGLTARQLDCVVLVARGQTDRQIAGSLGITEETVTAHLNEARRRYGVRRRAQLVLQALYRGDLTFSDVR